MRTPIVCDAGVCDLGQRIFRPAPRNAELGGEVAGHADVRQEIGPVGRDLHIVGGVVQREVLRRGRADNPGGVAFDDPGMLFDEPEFALGGQHPQRFVPLQLGLLNRHPVGGD